MQHDDHVYVDDEIVWEVVARDLPALVVALEKLTPGDA